jgi:hypothetical protein
MEDTTNAGELSPVQEPDSGDQIAQDLTSAQETGAEPQSDATGSIGDEAQDGGPVGGSSESIVE